MKVSYYLCDYCGEVINEPKFPQAHLHFCGSECQEEYVLREIESAKELDKLLEGRV